MLFINVSSALESQGNTKQYDNFTIVQTCSDATYITISTIQLPDKTVKTINQNMTSTGSGGFQYNQTDNIQLGRYDITGISDGCEKTFSFYYEVTPSGLTNLLGFYIIWIILSIGIIFLGYYAEDQWIVVLGSFALVLFGLYVLFFGIVDIQDNVYTWGMGIITLMLGLYFGVRGSMEGL